MAVLRKSAPAPTTVGAGAAKKKKGEITVVYVADIIDFPTRDSGKVKMLGNIVLKAGAKMEKLYLTPDTQKLTQEITGDFDYEAFIKKAEGIYPGNPIEIREFIANNLGVDVVLVFGEGCGENTGDVLGSPCNPMRLKGNYSNDKDGVKNTMMYEHAINDNEVIGSYAGEVYFAENHVAATVDLDLTIANGPVYQLPSLAVTDAITANSIDLEHETMVSFIGGGGADPATLTSGAQGQVSVILKNDTTWTALENAVISLQVYKAGATTYLIEQSRG